MVLDWIFNGYASTLGIWGVLFIVFLMWFEIREIKDECVKFNNKGDYIQRDIVLIDKYQKSIAAKSFDQAMDNVDEVKGGTNV